MNIMINVLKYVISKGNIINEANLDEYLVENVLFLIKKSEHNIYFSKDIQLKDFSFVKYLTKLRIMEIKMSGVDALTISDFINMPVINVWSVDTTSITNSKFKPNSTSAKGRKTINNGLKSYIKPEDYNNNEE